MALRWRWATPVRDLSATSGRDRARSVPATGSGWTGTARSWPSCGRTRRRRGTMGGLLRRGPVLPAVGGDGLARSRLPPPRCPDSGTGAAAGGTWRPTAPATSWRLHPSDQAREAVRNLAGPAGPAGATRPCRGSRASRSTGLGRGAAGGSTDRRPSCSWRSWAAGPAREDADNSPARVRRGLRSRGWPCRPVSPCTGTPPSTTRCSRPTAPLASSPSGTSRRSAWLRATWRSSVPAPAGGPPVPRAGPVAAYHAALAVRRGGPPVDQTFDDYVFAVRVRWWPSSAAYGARTERGTGCSPRW